MSLFALLRAMSFVNSAVFSGLLFFWLAPGFATETTVCGWAHGCLWIALSILCLIAVGRREIPFWLAVVVTVVGGVGPFAGTAGFVVETRRRRLASAAGGHR
ncbi:MAG: hypothetical protein QOE65_2241 [Solirubrobacteraceae bacterium]|nr:hypothetical protein [Solirubrobacteraceae bacterium]